MDRWNPRLGTGLMVALLVVVMPVPALAQFGLFGKSPDTISTKELQALLTKQQQAVKQATARGESVQAADFVLVDVRSDSETAVSVIPGAITLQQFEANKAQYRQRTIIPYCTVGGRSGSYAKQLLKDGYSVKNYKGSILEWIKHDLPLVTLTGESTRQVHTYDKRYRVPSGYEQVIR